jgi:hypothetical protein
MRRSYVVCPFCKPPREFALQGITMHVKVHHPNQFKEFEKKYAALKKTAVRREIVTGRKAARPAPPATPPRAREPVRDPPMRAEKEEVPAPGPAPRPEEPVKAPGGEAPVAGQGGEKSFLDRPIGELIAEFFR